ncbi:MAG: type II and III secretion system protein [Planctomycetes bacterium]|nr:type II and III secretion system protein [Planctomycetota bacterium]
MAATADGTAVGALAWSVGPAPGSVGALERPLGAPQDPAAQAPGRQGPPTEKEAEEARIRTQFGSSVLIGADGRVTKQYFLVGDLGATFLKLVTDIAPDKPAVAGASPVPPPGTRIGGAQSQSILGRMLGGREVEVTYVPDFEVLNSADLADPPAAGIVPSSVRGGPLPAGKAPSVALALITGLPSSLAAFEAALNLFYASIPQVEITVQVIEYSTADALAFGVSGIDTTGTPNFANLSSSQLVQAYTSIFPLRQPIVGASPVTDVGLFTLGGIHDSIELNVLLQALEANNIADITSSPKLVVRNGGVAAISTLTQVPFPRAKISQLGSQVATDIQFKPVGVKMNIIPTIAGTDSILLQVYADVSAITGFADTDPVVTPITSTRTAVTTVYLKDKHSLLIGGLKSQTTFENEQKVPILGDIPILGFLFRSTSIQRSDTNVAFQITPRIVTDRGTPVGSGPDD